MPQRARLFPGYALSVTGGGDEGHHEEGYTFGWEKEKTLRQTFSNEAICSHLLEERLTDGGDGMPPPDSRPAFKSSKDQLRGEGGTEARSMLPNSKRGLPEFLFLGAIISMFI